MAQGQEIGLNCPENTLSSLKYLGNYHVMQFVSLKSFSNAILAQNRDAGILGQSLAGIWKSVKETSTSHSITLGDLNIQRRETKFSVIILAICFRYKLV